MTESTNPLTRRDYTQVAAAFGFSDVDVFIRFVKEQNQRQNLRSSFRSFSRSSNGQPW